MAENIAVSSDFAQNTCIPASQQEVSHLFVKILLGSSHIFGRD